MRLRTFLFVFVALILVFSTGQPVLAANNPAPLIKGQYANTISDRYIVVFKPDVPDESIDLALSASTLNLKPETDYRYTSAVKGFSASLTPDLVEALRNNPDVAYIEQDQEIRLENTQTDPTWGLDRLDQRSLPLNKSFTYTDTAENVTVYVIDTGIYVTHEDFSGRATVGIDEVRDGQNGIDCNGHGTHVAGTIGGDKYGVAKAVKLVSVRVLNCSGFGTASALIAGIDWVTSHHTGPSVANLSLGGNPSTALDSAIERSIASGVVYTVAAGNEAMDACEVSPARVPGAITVGATSSSDTRPKWSNYGSCLDLFAPGVSIKSDWDTSKTATKTISGTSMAAPHAAGIAALYLSENPTASPESVAAAIIAATTPDVVKKAGTGSPNRLLYTDY